MVEDAPFLPVEGATAPMEPVADDDSLFRDRDQNKPESGLVRFDLPLHESEMSAVVRPGRKVLEHSTLAREFGDPIAC